jgi:hypothetical protein
MAAATAMKLLDEEAMRARIEELARALIAVLLPRLGAAGDAREVENFVQAATLEALARMSRDLLAEEVRDLALEFGGQWYELARARHLLN